MTAKIQSAIMSVLVAYTILAQEERPSGGIDRACPLQYKHHNIATQLRPGLWKGGIYLIYMNK